MPIWQSSRTLLVVTEDLRELAEAHGSWGLFQEGCFVGRKDRKVVLENRITVAVRELKNKSPMGPQRLCGRFSPQICR